MRRSPPELLRQQGSSQPATKQADDRTATPSLVRASESASGARPEMPHGWRALAMVTELLRYRPAPDHHNVWLQRIAELVTTVGDFAVFSCSLRPQPSKVNDEEQYAPPPPPWPGANHKPRQEACPRDRPRESREGPRDEARCQVVPWPHADARALPALQVPRRECDPLKADPVEH
ncbi:hypothetical protein D1007_11904 [Hordeum vulgare]|nr:hypothetical protein D1007_11904 [Hordeum vulgare]